MPGVLPLPSKVEVYKSEVEQRLSELPWAKSVEAGGFLGAVCFSFLFALLPPFCLLCVCVLRVLCVCVCVCVLCVLCVLSVLSVLSVMSVLSVLSACAVCVCVCSVCVCVWGG